MSRYLKDKSNLELIDEAYEAQLDPLWSPPSAKDWYDQYEGDIGVAQGASASDFMPEMDLLDWSAFAPLVGDVTGPMADMRMYARNPEELTAVNLGLSAMGALPFVPSVAGTLRGIKGRAAKQPYYHGTAASTSSKVTDPGVVLKSGYLKGQSQEMNTPGTSVSADPTTSLRAFTPSYGADVYEGRMKYGDPRRADAMLVNRLTDPDNVWNLPPDMYRTKMGPKDPEATFRKTNYFNEAETFAKRNAPSLYDAAEQEKVLGKLGEAIELADEYFSTGYEPLTDELTQQIDSLPSMLDEVDEFGVSSVSYMKEILSDVKSGKLDPDEGMDELISALNDAYNSVENRSLPGSSPAPGVTPVRGGVEVPSIGGFAPSPAPLTEQEAGHMSRAGAAYDQAERFFGALTPKSMVDIDPDSGRKFYEVPPAQLRKQMMTALDGMRGYQGSYRKTMDLVSRGIANMEAGPKTAIAYAIDDLPYESKKRIKQAANKYVNIHGKVNERGATLQSRGVKGGAGWGYNSIEEIDEAIKAGRVTLNDIGDPKFRQMYRDEAKARQHLHDVLHNEIFKTKKELHPLEVEDSLYKEPDYGDIFG